MRHFHLRARGAVVTLAQEFDMAWLSYEIYQHQSDAADQIVDGALAIEFNILRALCGPEWRPIELRFTHREPVDTGLVHRFFQCPLSFDAGQNAVVFETSWLNRRLPSDDPALRGLLLVQIDLLEAKHGDDLPAQVLSVLRTALLTRHANAEQVAALFSMFPHPGPAFRRLWHPLPGAGGRGPFRDRPPDAERLGNGGRAVRGGTGLCRPERPYTGISALERHHAGPIAAGAGRGRIVLARAQCLHLALAGPAATIGRPRRRQPPMSNKNDRSQMPATITGLACCRGSGRLENGKSRTMKS